MSTIVNIHQAKTHPPRILGEVAAGAEVVIAKAGKPVARLVPIDTHRLLWARGSPSKPPAAARKLINDAALIGYGNIVTIVQSCNGS